MRPKRPVVVEDDGVDGNPLGTAPCELGIPHSSLPQLD
jgi:hypothetical protein